MSDELDEVRRLAGEATRRFKNDAQTYHETQAKFVSTLVNAHLPEWLRRIKKAISEGKPQLSIGALESFNKVGGFFYETLGHKERVEIPTMALRDFRDYHAYADELQKTLGAPFNCRYVGPDREWPSSSYYSEEVIMVWWGG